MPIFLMTLTVQGIRGQIYYPLIANVANVATICTKLVPRYLQLSLNMLFPEVAIS